MEEEKTSVNTEIVKGMGGMDDRVMRASVFALLFCGPKILPLDKNK